MRRFVFLFLGTWGIGCDAWSPTVGEAIDSATSDVEVPPSDVSVDGDAPAEVSTDSGAVSFARDIRPLMNRAIDSPVAKGCRCHYPSSPTHIGLDLGGLDLSTLGTLREGGGSSGSRIIVPGDPDKSIIVQKLRGTYALGTRMPKNGPPFWTEAEIEIMRRWIAEGAKGKDDE